MTAEEYSADPGAEAAAAEVVEARHGGEGLGLP